MPRTTKLTWQLGKNGRAGRWRKKYKGKIYYFPGGRGKSDREAYLAAVEAWEAKKLEVDRSAPRPHQPEYEAVIETWEQVLTWCRKHGEGEVADEALAALESLRHRFEFHRLRPLATSDRFAGRFETPRIAAVDNVLDSPPNESELNALAAVVPQGELALDRPSNERRAQELNGSPLRLAATVWQDRLDVQRRDAAPKDVTIAHYVEVYVSQKLNEAQAGDLSVGRTYKLKLHLQDFCDWTGGSTDVNDITGTMLIEYKQRLLEQVAKGAWSRATAKDRLGTVRAFVRWLWRTEAIKSLPRVLDPKAKELTIKKTRRRPVKFANEELATLFREASTRTKLYMLLMLNCGMTQKDIADLDAAEVDWEAGRIIRKRSKTESHDNVPEVNYLLWPETRVLLARESSGNGAGRVLVNRDGGSLWIERYEAGKYQKTDNIKNAFDRLRKKTGIDKSLISLKKTSSSRLRSSEKYNSVRGLFLGHADGNITDEHYADVPESLLDRAIEWLRLDLGIDRLDLIPAEVQPVSKSGRRQAAGSRKR
jgi:integrase